MGSRGLDDAAAHRASFAQDTSYSVPTEQVHQASLMLSGTRPAPGQVHTPANLVWRRYLEYAPTYLFSFVDYYYPGVVDRLLIEAPWRLFLPVRELTGSWTTTTIILTHVVGPIVAALGTSEPELRVTLFALFDLVHREWLFADPGADATVDTADSLHNLAFLLLTQGELEAARPLFERALAVQERVLGPDHPRTSNSRRGLETASEVR